MANKLSKLDDETIVLGYQLLTFLKDKDLKELTVTVDGALQWLILAVQKHYSCPGGRVTRARS